jgi:Cytochrome C oxidase, cbb3-type, subunit III
MYASDLRHLAFSSILQSFPGYLVTSQALSGGAADMSGSRRSFRSGAVRQGLYGMCAGAFLLALGTGCGKERSGAVSSDSTAMAPDTGKPAASDTSRSAAETTATASTDSARETAKTSVSAGARPDTTRTTATKSVHSTPTTRATSPRTRPTAKPARDTSGAAASASGPQAGASDTSHASGAQAGDSSAAGEQTNASAPLRDPYHHAPLDTVSQQVYDGWKQFNLNCARCHGEDAQGTTIAPHLIVSLKPDGPINTKEIFMQTVCAGRPAKGMPSWCALGMEMSTIEAIYSYVKGRSDAKIHPGRPAVKAGG